MYAFHGVHPAGVLRTSKFAPGKFVPANGEPRMARLELIEVPDVAPWMAAINPDKQFEYYVEASQYQ